MPTLDHWHSSGGLVARGVLIDYKTWWEEEAAAEGIDGEDATYGPFDGHRITVDDIETIAKKQNVEFRHGDVLIVRTGMTEALEAPTPNDFAKMMRFQMAGVDGTKETAKWIWNKHFSAVAGDAIAFEALPPLDENRQPSAMEGLGESLDPRFYVPFLSTTLTILVVLHPWLLSMFGMSIGELWDLKALSAHCKKAGRYSFLLTSAPLNIPGLVGSPPNALAIF